MSYRSLCALLAVAVSWVGKASADSLEICDEAQFSNASDLTAFDCVLKKPEDQETWGELLYRFIDRQSNGKTYAILVGVSDYDTVTPDLPTEEDPVTLAGILIDVFGYDQVHVLTEDAVTQERLRRLIQSEYGKLRKEDRLLFYWIGHGHSGATRLGRPEQGFFVLKNSNASDVSTMVPMKQLVEWVDDYVDAEQVLFVIDACFSGYAAPAVAMGTAASFLGPSRQLLLASAEDQSTFATNDPAGGAFTRQFIKGILGEADTLDPQTGKSDGVVRATELILHLQRRMKTERQEHNWVDELNPQLVPLGNQKGDFFFLPRSTREAALLRQGMQPTEGYQHGVPNAVPIGPSADPASSDGRDLDGSELATEFSVVRERNFEDWKAEIVRSGEGLFCRLTSTGVSGVNARIAAGLSSLERLVPYKNSEVSRLLLTRASSSTDYELSYENDEFSTIYPTVATSFDIDVLT